ncbi:MAG: deoxynucleoside kinase [Pseudomonadales bacterium]|jgi:deoxyadenosine/deoxycytidine kinase|nr:deoxynucleoside kinase [Pseudomonadales bacterium]
MHSTTPGYIVVEGPIGVGKTTLVKRLASTFNYDTLLEDADQNPFLADFYRNPKASGLATQLFFLLQRAQQTQAIRQSDIFTPVRISDFLIEKDRLFASLILDEEELNLYDQIYNHLTIDVPTPDLVIYLQAPTSILTQRIQKRGIPYEQTVRKEYLDKINEAYTRFFHYYDRSPLLIINAAEIDFVSDNHGFQMLVDQIKTAHRGRHYFNPGPKLI